VSYLCLLPISGSILSIYVEFMSICVEFMFSSRQMSLYKGSDRGSLRGLLVTQCCHDYNHDNYMYHGMVCEKGESMMVFLAAVVV